MALSNEQFLEQLATLFAKQKDKGSVFLTQKRYTFEGPASTSTAGGAAAGAGGEDVEMGEAGRPAGDHDGDVDEREWPLFIRATDGESKKDIKVKISTVVQPAAYDSFMLSYSALLRSTFSAGLRPKRKRAPGAAAAAKKKKLAKRKARTGVASGGAGGEGEGEEDDAEPAGYFSLRLPKVVGPRRGNGVKKRRRALKRREKIVGRVKASKARKSAAATAE
ncbi:hypothetical protein JCM8097_004725 [Rhodosporidiobolus ruineniae]